MAAAAAATALWGCRRSAAPPPAYSSGYVRLEALISLHPGWEDVRKLDALLRHAKTLPVSRSVPQPSAGEVRFPPALAASPTVPADYEGAEQRLIESVRAPAEKRVESLRNTLAQVTDRAVARREEELKNTVALEEKQAEDRLTQEGAAKKAALQAAAHTVLRDLGMKAIALDSQVATLAKYPGDTRAAQVPVRRRLGEVRDQIAAREAQLSEELQAVDAQTEQRIAAAKRQAQTSAARALAAYRQEQEKSTARKVENSRQLVNYVLASLEPLSTPTVPAAPPVAPALLGSPSALAPAAAAPQPALNVAAQTAQANLAGERERLISYITDDVKRRLDRLSIQYRWHLAFAPTQGLPDLTSGVADVLRGEWKP